LQAAVHFFPRKKNENGLRWKCIRVAQELRSAQSFHYNNNIAVVDLAFRVHLRYSICQPSF